MDGAGAFALRGEAEGIKPGEGIAFAGDQQQPPSACGGVIKRTETGSSQFYLVGR